MQVRAREVLPLRGDPQSRLVIGLALLYRFSGWFCMVWMPIGIMFALPSLLQSEDSDEPAFMVGFAIGLIVGLLLGALIWFLLARGIMSGNLAAYLVTALGFAFGAMFMMITGIVAAMSSAVPVAVSRISYSLALSVFAVVAFILCLQKRVTDG
jgi:hypothetical protein